MNDVIELAIRELIDNHRCEFDDIIYKAMRQQGLLSTAPFQRTIIDDTERYGEQEAEDWMGRL